MSDTLTEKDLALSLWHMRDSDAATFEAFIQALNEYADQRQADRRADKSRPSPPSKINEGAL